MEYHIIIFAMFVVVLIRILLNKLFRRDEVEAFGKGDTGMIDGDFIMTVLCTKRVLATTIVFHAAIALCIIGLAALTLVHNLTAWAVMLMIAGVIFVSRTYYAQSAYKKYCLTVQDIVKELYKKEDNGCL